MTREQRINPPCRWRGEFDCHVPCRCPSGHVAAFVCELGGLCTITRPAIDRDVAFCPQCAAREEAET